VGVAMPTQISEAAIKRSRAMRKNLTEGEARLWAELKQFKRLYGLHVRKQAPIGPYFADFAVQAKKLVIEVDGERHFSAEGILGDQRRDAWLAERGYRVLRINTGELSENFDGCIETILRELGVA
jgi:very-short-patch-repair endonuclease